MNRHVEALGVCIPVHNEEAMLPRTLRALDRAMCHRDLREIDLRLGLVLDDCSDRSASIVLERSKTSLHYPTLVFGCSARNVGMARQIGFLGLIESFGDCDPARIWLATTDADSEVPTNWLKRQVECRRRSVEFWAGRVEVADWAGRAQGIAERWSLDYREEAAPIHGASLAMSAELFLRVGGFLPLCTGEDGAIRDAALRLGSSVCHDSQACVRTSSRTTARAPLGFAHYLDRLEASG